MGDEVGVRGGKQSQGDVSMGTSADDQPSRRPERLKIDVGDLRCRDFDFWALPRGVGAGEGEDAGIRNCEAVEQGPERRCPCQGPHVFTRSEVV